MNLIRDIIQELKNISSMNAKKEILLKNEDNILLKDILYFTYNPYIQYGIKKTPTYEKEENNLSLSLEDFYNDFAIDRDLRVLYERERTGHDAINYLISILSDLHEADEEIFMNMIKKDLRIGISEKTINKVWPNLIPVYPIMKASKNDEKGRQNITFPCILQLKNDGARCNILKENGHISFRSSSGREMFITDKDFLEEIRQYVPDNYVIDGELVGYNGKIPMERKISNGICTKVIRNTATEEDMEKLRFVAWDIISIEDFKNGFSETDYQIRFNLISNIINSIGQYSKLFICPSKHVFSWEEALEITNQYIAEGKEGSIIKNIRGPWENKRSKYHIKIKAERDADLRIIGFEEGTGKYKGKLGSIQLVSSCGLLRVNVGSGLTDSNRDFIWKHKDSLLGKIVELQYNEIIDSEGKDTKSLFLPVFTQIRHDKLVADSLEELK